MTCLFFCCLCKALCNICFEKWTISKDFYYEEIYNQYTCSFPVRLGNSVFKQILLVVVVVKVSRCKL